MICINIINRQVCKFLELSPDSPGMIVICNKNNKIAVILINLLHELHTKDDLSLQIAGNTNRF